ncbi:MAG: PTS sugar transporter subunit IIA [Desulfobacter sp.]|nr:PTS sugar transporter subunit IIA [Desulfobacter sp.]WDP86620.1 MAG: PTS sugar transporter subunit IIA [Desulfobacter sp.]
MKISEILNKDSILADLAADNKTGVIRELANAAAKAAGAPTEEIASVIMERETLGSTGIGGGIAIPHGKLDGVSDVTVGFGLSRKGIDYDSLDNQPVHIFFLLLTPENNTGSHLKVLAQISKLLKMDSFKDRLQTAESAQQIHGIIMEQDEEF